MDKPWFREQGFYTNPFSIKPAAFHSEIVGYKLEPLIELIKSGGLAFVQAPLGSGKTTILKSILRRFGGRRKVIYYNHVTSEGINVEELLRNASLRGKFFGRLPTDMVLLADEADDMTVKDTQNILEFVNGGNLRSVVFFGTKYDPSHFDPSMREQLAKNNILLGQLTQEQAVELIRKRIGELPLLPGEIISQIFARVNYSPRQLLEACEDVCSLAVREEKQKVDASHVDRVLGVSKLMRRRAPVVKPVVIRRKKTAKKKVVKKPARKKKETIVIRDADDANFNLENIRSYDEEMELFKEEARTRTSARNMN